MAAMTGLTIDDFERLPADAVKHRELVDGELIDVSGNTPRHNKLRDRLVALLLRWLENGYFGYAIAEQEYDFLGNAHGPDVTYLRPEKQAMLDLRMRVQGFVPDLAACCRRRTEEFVDLAKISDLSSCGAGTLQTQGDSSIR